MTHSEYTRQAAQGGKAIITEGGVRLRLYAAGPGNMNWLFLPGGPGMGSDYLGTLADVLNVPGSIWLVDLPGDGSNTNLPSMAGNFYRQWPKVLTEAARFLPQSIYVGHSTGAMYLLSVPELEQYITGIGLISTAPDSSWREYFARTAEKFPLLAVTEAAKLFMEEKTNERLREMTMAAAPWSFTRQGFEAGRAMLSALPYNVSAMEWSDKNFDTSYCAKWWPGDIPALVIHGADDAIISPMSWGAPQYHGDTVIHKVIPSAGHFPWMDQPGKVHDAFIELVERIRFRPH